MSQPQAAEHQRGRDLKSRSIPVVLTFTCAGKGIRRDFESPKISTGKIQKHVLRADAV